LLRREIALFVDNGPDPKALEEARQNLLGDFPLRLDGNGKILDDGKVRPLDVKVGDRVLFGKYSGTAVKIEGDEFLVMREEDVMGVIAK
jgi:hypothetical protein